MSSNQNPAAGPAPPTRLQSALCVAVLGAESTGKTTLAQALHSHFCAPPHSLRVAWVPEALRQWCEQTGRTPLQHEQLGILQTQSQRIHLASQDPTQHPDLVLCDTTGLMTAVYSDVIFGDTTLVAQALAGHHQAVHLTLLTAPDLPWVPDGHQRDGPHMQTPVDQALRKYLAKLAAPVVHITGPGPQRLAQAVAAVEDALQEQGRRQVANAISAATGLPLVRFPRVLTVEDVRDLDGEA